MATDRDLLKTAEKGRLGSTSIANVATAVEATHRRVVTWHNITLESNAAANGTEYHIARFPRACKVVSAYETEHANVAADTSHYLTLTLAKRTAGGAATTLGTYVGNVALTAWVPNALTLSSNATVLELAAGDSLTIKTTKTGNGRAFIAYAQLTVDIEEI
jgi:hypothetical protein